MVDFLLVRHGATDWVDGQTLHGIAEIQVDNTGKTKLNLLSDHNQISDKNL